MVEPTSEQPLLLVATEGEWAGRSLESMLTECGYAVLRTQSGAAAIDLARRTNPDGLIVDEHMGEMSGLDVCRVLRADPTFDPATPIVVVAATTTAPAERAAAYAAGAWSVCAHPVDTEILMHELGTFIRARRSVSRAKAQSLVDPTTGLLSAAGLERWAQQLGARALRNHEPLACVVLMAPVVNGTVDAEQLADIGAAFIESSKSHMRRSDIAGLTRDGRLAVLAPDTDDAGAVGLVERLRAAIEATATEHSGRTSSGFRAGYCAVPDFSSAELEAPELLQMASQAVEFAGSDANTALTLNFSQIPIDRRRPVS